MPNKRPVIPVNDGIYHIYNRSVGGSEIFTQKRFINRFIELIKYYRYETYVRFSFLKFENYQKNHHLFSQKLNPYVEIYAYCLMPNHFHLLVKQIYNNGIRKFMANIQNSFAKYFNLNLKRNGSLFQHPFKAKYITTEEEFLHVSRYIHLNPVTANMFEIDKLLKSNLTSMPFYLSKINNSFVNTSLVFDMMKTSNKYIRFISDQINYQKKLNIIKHLTID